VRVPYFSLQQCCLNLLEFSNLLLQLTVGSSTLNVSSTSVSPSTQLGFVFIVPTGASGVLTQVRLLYGFARDQGSQNALTDSVVYTLPVVVTLDTSPPAIVSAVLPAAGTYTSGTMLNFFVNYSEPIQVTGLVQLTFSLSHSGVNTSVLTGDGVVVGGAPTLLQFSYTVPAATIGGPVYVGLSGFALRQSASSPVTASITDVVASGFNNVASLPVLSLPFSASTASAITLNTAQSVNGATLVVGTATLTASGLIDNKPFSTETLVLSNTGNQNLQWNFTISPNSGAWSLRRSSSPSSTTGVNTDIAAGTSLNLFMQFNPANAGATTVTTLTLSCPACSAGTQSQSVTVYGTATVPIHFVGMSFPAPGNYRTGQTLTFRATYNTTVSIDDSRAAIVVRLQTGDDQFGKLTVLWIAVFHLVHLWSDVSAQSVVVSLF
jgi:hypothetical protein